MTIAVYCVRVSDMPVFYVGSSQNVEKRLQVHEQELLNGCHQNKILQAAMDASVEKKLVTTVIPMETLELARETEQVNIEEHASNPNFANIGTGVYGGDNLTRHPDREDIVRRITAGTRKRALEMSDEERQKLSARTSGSNNPMYGKTHTEEARRKISETHLGQHHGLGRKLNPEHIAKISERQKQRVGPLNSFYGKTHSDEYKQWASESRLGIKNLTTANEIEIDGIRYESQSAAAKALGTCAATITYRLGSKNPKYAQYRVMNKQEEK